ncbi:DNA repair-scaffolding protein isoform X2 [Syngnathus scovelli]|uniref:DNA repair-scaffolding protein isoform X2 n=1 Tax=Syngnathus scovelli TaxID=161590 RepID=UPI0021104C1D|nr:DNA repair-scaffolding protein isoform X2 [Syngnathus scovelli]
MSSRKRKKWSKDLKYVVFPDNIECGVRKPSAISSSSSARSWEECGEGFLHSSVVKNVKTSGRPLSLFNHHNEDPVDIAWSSSSDSGPSDNDETQQQRHHRPGVTSSHSRPKALHTLSTDDVDPAIIETDESEQDVEKDSGQQISDCESPSCDDVPEDLPAETTDLEISGFASDGETDDDPLPDGGHDAESLRSGQRSASDWVQFPHTMLQTPKRPFKGQSIAPKCLALKKTFQSGGFAERLNRVNCRQKTAVNFWRNRSTSDNLTETQANRPGVLVLEVLEVQEECSTQLVRCQHHPPPLPPADPRVLVLLCRERAAQLNPAPADIIHIYPPWESLFVERLGCDVILNVCFSQKVHPASNAARAPPTGWFAAKRLAPYPLCETFATLSKAATTSDGPSRKSSAVPARRCHSLLEAVEALDQAGSLSQDVVVLVQRVYSIPAPAVSIARIRRNSSAPPPPPEQGKRRLCVLVQDSFGIFSVVQLHRLALDDLHRYYQAWRGRTCALRGIKVVQCVTRDRDSSLFSLIDSLWPPPKLPLECHGNVPSMPSSRPPSFCYILSGQESSIETTEEGPGGMSPFHLPPARQTLRDILQDDHKTYCCTFIATVIYKRIQTRDVGQGEVWLVLTDQSLQDSSPDRPCRRTVALHVNTSCALTSCVLKALSDPAGCRLSFTDAIKKHGVLLCVKHSIIEVMDSVTSGLMREPQAQPARLDPLDEGVTPNSLCTLSGVIVAVDESASYSWPVCNLCGSHDLELTIPPPRSVHCVSCKSTVVEPITKVQMSVFLRSASLQNCTIKVKLQENTIMYLLDTAGLDHTTAFPEFEVSSVLGKEVGPLTLYVRLVSRRPSLWISLEEICL